MLLYDDEIMKVETEVVKNCLLIALDGRLDAHNSPAVQSEIDRLLEARGERVVILNLDRVEYLSSSGLHVLVAIARDLKKNDRDLRLCRLPDAVIRILELMEITGMFAIYSSEEEALESAGG